MKKQKLLIFRRTYPCLSASLFVCLTFRMPHKADSEQWLVPRLKKQPPPMVCDFAGVWLVCVAFWKNNNNPVILDVETQQPYPHLIEGDERRAKRCSKSCRLGEFPLWIGTLGLWEVLQPTLAAWQFGAGCPSRLELAIPFWKRNVFPGHCTLQRKAPLCNFSWHTSCWFGFLLKPTPLILSLTIRELIAQVLRKLWLDTAHFLPPTHTHTSTPGALLQHTSQFHAEMTPLFKWGWRMQMWAGKYSTSPVVLSCACKQLHLRSEIYMRSRDISLLTGLVITGSTIF